MKNLQLKAMEFGANEILTRQQLKNTVGGVKAFCFCNGVRNTPFNVTFTRFADIKSKVDAHCAAFGPHVKAECWEYEGTDTDWTGFVTEGWPTPRPR